MLVGAFGSADPWRAMAAAVRRTTGSGVTMGEAETLTPEQALALYTSSADSPGVVQRTLAVGAEASLCLLDCPWAAARTDLSSAHVRATWRRGELIYDRDLEA